MVLSEVFDRFVRQSPIAVMVRATMENVLSAERLNELFVTAKPMLHSATKVRRGNSDQGMVIWMLAMAIV
jgi:hypothetical protein